MEVLSSIVMSAALVAIAINLILNEGILDRLNIKDPYEPVIVETEEKEMCVCDEYTIEECPDAYEHMTHGV